MGELIYRLGDVRPEDFARLTMKSVASGNGACSMTLANTHSLVSVIVPVGERQTPMADLYAEYKSGLRLLGAPYELIFVLDGLQPTAERALAVAGGAGRAHHHRVPDPLFRRSDGVDDRIRSRGGRCHRYAAGLSAGRRLRNRQTGRALDAADIVVGYREPRASSWFQTLRHRVFHGLLHFVTRLSFRDLGCNVRALKRKVLEEVHLYGDQQRFLPLLAERQGFQGQPNRGAPVQGDRRDEMYRPRNYTRGLLDIFNVFFLIRFTKKPLRFFGMIGVAIFSLGILELMYLIFDRIYFHHPLADRPALLLASLMIVLGVQMFALGLLGELIIFTHAGGSKDYKVDRVIQYAGPAPAVH